MKKCRITYVTYRWSILFVNIIIYSISDIYAQNINQDSISIYLNTTYQTIHGFGASDAWDIEYLAKYWSADVNESIAKHLFSKEIDSTGNAKGIGLSIWRFNIGAGSAEQGDESQIDEVERRVECFLTDSGTYDWSKQSGQQWYLRKAKEYGVENITGFITSPPRYFTKNGRTNSDNPDRLGNTNLSEDKYGEFAQFIANVLKHFSDEGLEFSQISPVNEPQYEWNGGHEGSPWKNFEIKKLVNELNQEIIKNNLETKILLAESGSFEYLYQVKDDPEKSLQIDDFFNPVSSNYLGDNAQVLPGIASHSYWTANDDATLKDVREKVAQEAKKCDIELYQTEYCLLGTHKDDKFLNSLFLAKVIHADLAIANVSIWNYWTACERERWGQKNRFYLIHMIPINGEYSFIDEGGTISVDKNLWILGHYSRFIRPGYQRVNLINANDLTGLMGTAYIAPDKSRIVIVYINYATHETTVINQINNIPEDKKIAHTITYTTDKNRDFEYQEDVDIFKEIILNQQSITTFVINLDSLNTSNHSVNYSKIIKNNLEVFPNAALNNLVVNFSESIRITNILFYTLDGKVIKKIEVPAKVSKVKINTENFPLGCLILQVITKDKEIINCKVYVSR